MRIALLYGALLGVLQTVATLVIYACGLHSAPEKLEGAHRLESLADFVIMMACLSLGLRGVRRTLSAGGKAFTFGTGTRHALGIAILGSLVTAIGQYVYVAAVNPAFSDHLRAALVAGAQLKPEQAAAYQSQLGFATSPHFRALSQGLTTFFFSLLIGLAYAFLFRDRPAGARPPATAES